MKKPSQTTTILTIHAENAKGVLARVLGILDRPNYYVAALTMAKTDINGQVVITLEAAIPEPVVRNLLLRLEKIIEVASASSRLIANEERVKAAVFEIDAEAVDSRFWRLIQKYGADVTFSGGRLVVQKTAQASDLLELYNQLDKAYLITYSETIVALS